MRIIPLAILLLVAASPALGADHFDLSCEGVFGPDMTHERLIEAYGHDNVRFTQVADTEATYPEVTVIFPADPARRLAIYWGEHESRSEPMFIIVPDDTLWTVNGLHIGMPIADVEALNGRPFDLGGFGDMGRGMVERWNGGKLSSDAGACRLQVGFRHPFIGVPTDLDDPVSDDESHSSDDPNLRALGAKIGSMTLYYGD